LEYYVSPLERGLRGVAFKINSFSAIYNLQFTISQFYNFHSPLSPLKRGCPEAFDFL
jgi:hypothetical protein